MEKVENVVAESVEVVVEKPKKEQNQKKKKKNKKNVDLEFIGWENFSNEKILHDGVCGGKVCCIFVDYKGKRYVLKEMKKSFNYGIDYVFMDRLKKKEVTKAKMEQEKEMVNGFIIIRMDR